MGRIVTPTFRSEIDLVHLKNGARETTIQVFSGRATVARVDAYVKAFEESTLPGGCNAHLGILLVREMRVIRQSTGAVAATSSSQPMFQVA